MHKALRQSVSQNQFRFPFSRATACLQAVIHASEVVLRRFRGLGPTALVCLLAACATACLQAVLSGSEIVTNPDRAEMVRHAAAAGEGTWKKVQGPDANLSSRELFAYALALAETGTHAERLEPLFDLAARMQDRDPASRGYGNFRWSWSNETVMDFNAVEFCMQGGALLWMRHRDALPAAARSTLRETLDYAAEGCLRHRVGPAYTNIALMNAQNLILLGETLEKAPVADEGYRRLDAFLMHTFENGVSEYGSPCYYGVDLDCLGLIEAFAGRERGRAQARALLELFWTDVAANFFGPSLRLGGPHSRDYNYLRGNGSVLDTHLWAGGWLPGGPRGGLGALWPALARWQPPADLLQMGRTRFPRLVRQSWGPAEVQSHTQYLLPDVTLGSAAANYHNMDLPLTVDLPGDSTFPRCYFIPDARHDPYGKKKVQEGRGPHAKTLHLRPFWTAAQRTCDAVGLVLYRDEDMTKTATTLESHFVVPRRVDGFWSGDEPVAPDATSAPESPIAAGKALVLRRGTAAVGVRVVWSRGVAGREPAAALVDDGNEYGVVRLTVTHYRADAPPETVVGAGAAFWVHIGGGLDTAEKFETWRRAFAEAQVHADLAANRLTVRAAGTDGPLTIACGYPDGSAPAVQPPPSRAILELDGDDVGRRLLAQVEPVRSYIAHLVDAPPVPIGPGKDVYLEAESGYAVAPMTVADDAAASGGRFAWQPGDTGGRGGGSGRILWNLDVAAPGDCYVWGRVLSPTPEDDSFFLSVTAEGGRRVADVEWHTGVHKEWTWVRLSSPGEKVPAPIALPKGKVRLEIRAREDGTRLDRLFLTTNANAKPQ